MFESIHTILSSENVLTHKNSGITIVKVTNSHEGLQLVKKILLTIVDMHTLLLLSGGRTPKELYVSLASENNFHPGAVGMVDERYGKSMHANSNELMLEQSGLLNLLKKESVTFYPMLDLNQAENDSNRKFLADNYDQMLRSLFTVYSKSVAILGIGLDGHTAGIPASPIVWKEGFRERSKHAVVSEFDDHGGFYGERITMTFLGLSMLDLLLVLVFGDDKKEALEKVFETGSKEEIPGRFYKESEIATKTIFITDQDV